MLKLNWKKSMAAILGAVVGAVIAKNT